MERYSILTLANLDAHPTTLAGFAKWLKAAFAAVTHWVEHEAGTCEADADFYGAVANRASKLARRMGAGHLAAPHINTCSHAKAFDLLGRLMQWTEQQKPSGAWSTHEIAKWMKVSPDKVLTWIRNGELKAANIAENTRGKPKYRVDPAEFDAFLLRRAFQPAAPLGRRRRRSAV